MTANKFVLDSSVYIAYFSPKERHHELAKTMWNLCPNDRPFHVPGIFPLEIVSAFVRRGESNDVIEQNEAYASTANKFIIHAVDKELIRMAVDIVRAKKIRAADSIYVALAKKLKAKILSLDKEIMNRL